MVCLWLLLFTCSFTTTYLSEKFLRGTQLTRCIVSTPFSLLVQTLMLKKDRKLPRHGDTSKGQLPMVLVRQKREWGHPIQRVMGALLVVSHPGCTNFPDLVQGFEHIGIQHFMTEGPIEPSTKAF